MSDGDYGGDSGHDASPEGHGNVAEGVMASHSASRNHTGIVSEDRKVEIHVQSHGACDIKQLFFREAEKLGLVPIHINRPNLVPEDRTEKKIFDWDAFSPPDDERVMPFGYYKGATGWTRLWKEFWHLGRRKEPWKFWTPLEPDFEQRTWLDVTCVTWCYDELGDLETKLEFEVRSLYAWDRGSQAWKFDELHFQRHKAVAEKLAKAMLAAISAYKPFPYATKVREQWRAEAGRPATPAPSAATTAQAAATTAPAATPAAPRTPVVVPQAPQPAAGSGPTATPKASTTATDARCDLGDKASGADISRLLGF